MVGLQITAHVPAKHRQEFVQSVNFFARREQHRGCIGRVLFEEIDKADRFIWVEHWADEKALKDYLITDRFRALMGAFEVLGELEDVHLIEITSLRDDQGNIHLDTGQDPDNR